MPREELLPVCGRMFLSLSCSWELLFNYSNASSGYFESARLGSVRVPIHSSTWSILDSGGTSSSWCCLLLWKDCECRAESLPLKVLAMGKGLGVGVDKSDKSGL